MQKGRIIKAISGFYYIKDAHNQIYQTRARGVFRLQKVTPVVGDYVEFESDNLEEGTLTKVLPRKNELSRPLIANVDVGVIVTSVVDPKLSTALLDRFLVHLEKNHIQPVIYISKMDIANDHEKIAVKDIVYEYEKIGYHVIAVDEPSKEEAISKIKNAFAKDFNQHTIMFMGQSGAGKSTLLNLLDENLNLKTGQTSQALGRGKHTTRTIELLPLLGGEFADTPGFSTLNFEGIEQVELTEYFPEMLCRRDMCRFTGCLHDREPKCAIKSAVAQNEISEFRYQNYLNFLDEIRQQVKY
ncbi:ribosome small subunit-dependent GTPase A [Allofustis seminis]|uniref:ribosome small subunit-dependent GTPase A n=1 Tax=Allofustis seminis TaxID=166939 RepID=UPI00037497CE|nr:ribosome small subunit-dependent GTPase A [Allofustis seminis]